MRIERYRQDELPPGERALFQAELIVDPQLRENTVFQATVHRLVTLYHRKKLRKKVQSIHDRLFHDPAKTEFKHSVLSLFKS